MWHIQFVILKSFNSLVGGKDDQYNTYAGVVKFLKVSEQLSFQVYVHYHTT